MNIKNLMTDAFKDVEGGLFGEVSKADVGDNVGKLLDNGVKIMAWADVFYPDPAIPESVMKATVDAINTGFPSHYSMPIGLKELRGSIAKKVSKQTGLNIDPGRNVIVTPGSDSGLIFAMMPFLDKGDEVMVPNPSYPNNSLNPKLLGAKTVPVPIYEENNYQFDIKEFKKRLTDKTKMVLITHPNNPTTTVFRRESLEALSKFIIDNNLILVSDQAFEDHIYDGIEFVHPCTLPGMWERTITVCSLSKGLGLSGYRVGYIYTNDHIMDVLYGSAVSVVGATSTASSFGAIAALEDDNILPEIYEKLKRRKDIVEEELGNIPGTKLLPTESGMLTWINVKQLGTSNEVYNYILENAKILVNEGSPYGSEGEGYLRIVSGAILDDDEAREALHKIRQALIELGKTKLK